MSRESEIVKVAEVMSSNMQALKKAVAEREKYTDYKQRHYVHVAGSPYYYFDRVTEAPNEFLNSIRLAHIAAADKVIASLKAKIEGGRWMLIQLGKATS